MARREVVGTEWLVLIRKEPNDLPKVWAAFKTSQEAHECARTAPSEWYVKVESRTLFNTDSLKPFTATMSDCPSVEPQPEPEAAAV